METGLNNLDVFNDAKYVMNSGLECLRIDGEELENCKDFDEDYLEFLQNILSKSAEELEKDEDFCSKDLSDKDLNDHDHDHDHVVNSENENSSLKNILDKSVKESEEVKDSSCKDLSDEDVNDHDHIVNSVGKSEKENENSDDDDPHYKLFLSRLKCHGQSFTYEAIQEKGLPKIIEYQKEEPVDGRHDMEMDRNMNNGVERDRKRSRSEPKNSKNVKKRCKTSSTPSHKHTSRKERVSQFQSKCNKDGLGKMGEEQPEKSLSPVRHVIKREQDSLVEESYQCFLNSAEIVSGRINLTLENEKKIVYDGEVDSDDVLCHEVKSMKPRSSGEINVEDDDSCQIVDVSDEIYKLKEKVMAVLRKPFDEQEYNTLWDLITLKNRNERHKELRHGREKSFTTEIKAKSYLEQHKDLQLEIEAVLDDKGKRLNILRGFFFWLQHLAWGAFKPWKDASCLAVVPGSH